MSTQPVHGVPPLTLGWRMQIALRHAGMTVQDMADELGMARSSLSRWLNDHGAPPRAAFLKQWALRTGVSYLWLSTGEIPAQPDGPGGDGLPRLDSNQQPSGYTPSQVSDLRAERNRRRAVRSDRPAVAA